MIVDSYAWVEFLTAGPNGPKAREAIEASMELVTPDIVLAEVARVFARQGMDRALGAGHLRSIGALSRVVPVDVDVALESVDTFTELRLRSQSRGLGPPSFADSIILAMARRLGGTVLTADAHFRGLPDTAWIGT